MRSIEIARLEHIEVSSLGEENFRWSIDLYDKRKKDNEKILKSIEKSLSSKLSKNHRSNISYDVLSELDGRKEVLGLCLFMHYSENSDMDIDSVIDFSIKHVENILKSIKAATEIEGVDLSRVKIEAGIGEKSTIDGTNLIIPKSVSSAVNDIISNISQNGKYTYTIGKNKIDLDIKKPDRSIREDDKNNLLIAEVLGVVEKSSTAHIRVDKGPIQQFKYYGALRDELITAQLKRSNIHLTVRLNYFHEKGLKLECGGTIVGCDFIDNNNSNLFEN